MKQEDVKLSPFDHGFLYGLGLFETFRTYNGHPFLLDDHFHRLNESGEMLNISMQKYDRDYAKGIIDELLRLNGLEDGYFRWNISAGDRQIGLSTELYEQSNTIVYVKPLSLGVIENKKAQTLTLRRNTPEGSHRLKSHHYLNNILGKRELSDHPSAEGIFLTDKGFLSEGIVSNLFWVKDGTLYTPDMTCGCLNGITRQYLIAFAEKEAVTVKKGEFRLEFALDADEVMVTNSVQGIVPISEWDGHRFPGNRGSWFQWSNNHLHQHTSFLWSKEEL